MEIRVRGAAENNLREIDVDFAEGLTVVTGVSGSGKSSLVFDTLHREVERRFVDVFGKPGEGMRLPPVRVRSVTGSGPAVAVGQNLLNRNPASLVATASGLHPFLRLLYARFGERSCPACGEPLVLREPAGIVEAIVEAAKEGVDVLVPLLRGAGGSHRTLLSILVRSLGAEAIVADGKPLGSRRSLRPEAEHEVDLLLGSLAAGTGILAARGSAREMLSRSAALGGHGVILVTGDGRKAISRDPVCLRCGRPFHPLDPSAFHPCCLYCAGRGCPRCREALAVRWQGKALPELLSLEIDAFGDLQGAFEPLPGAVRLYEEMRRRLAALRSVGLGYVSLDRPVPTLSRGEAQRLRLAVALASRLEDMVHLLDEPTIGQHPRDVASLVTGFRALPGPVIFVEHDRRAALLADHAVEIGPEAGSLGGRLLYSGTVAGLLREETHTGRAFRGAGSVPATGPTTAEPASAGGAIRIRGASARNLAGVDVEIPVGRLTVITGVSGSGKSTLVEEVLVPSVRSREPVGCAGIETPRLRPVVVDQSPIGSNPRSNPATYTGLAAMLRDLYARETGLGTSTFSFNRPEGACPACEGMGAVEVRMRYLPSSWVRCEECDGRRFRPEVLARKLELSGEELSIADFYERPVADVASLLEASGRAARFRKLFCALLDVGLGYLRLGQPSPSLSGGEAQRVKLTKYLGRSRLVGELLILDEPSTGLHPHDIGGLLVVLRRIVAAGATVVVVEHDTDVIRAADWCIDLGPEAGPRGGKVLFQGPLAGLAECSSSATGAALRAESAPLRAPRSRGHGKPRKRAAEIKIRGASANNLRGVGVTIPKGSLTAVTGISGSGKSSLVRDVLEAEARRRYLESLSLYERQGTKEGAEAEVEEVSGLGVTVSVSSRRWAFGLRVDVGWASEISRHLAVLFSGCGVRSCPSCAAVMGREGGRSSWRCPGCGLILPALRSEHFSLSSYAAACTRCHGVGSLQVPAPEKLVIHPERPLCGGAMYSPGFFPQGYLCKPGNGGYDQVQALARRHGFDPCSTPWEKMTERARQAFLFGDPEPQEVTFRGKSGRTYTRTLAYRGFYAFIGDWDVGGTYSTSAPCPECGGARLRPEYAAVRLSGHTIRELREMPLRSLREALQGVATSRHPGPVRASASTIDRRLGFLCRVGLGYVHLGRIASTLSAGEAQRVRLSGMLGSGLTSLTVLLDEPSRGLHPVEVEALAEVLLELRDEGNTVVVVEHDLELVRRADLVVEMGPGAGRRGGRVVARCAPKDLAAKGGPTGKWLSGGGQETAACAIRARRDPSGFLVIRSPRENNLDGRDVRIPLGVLAGVCGVSGSGKSTLCIDTLARALVPAKITTSVAREPLEPGRHDGIEGAPERTLVLDQVARGVPSPWRFFGLDARIASIYAESPGALEGGLTAEALTRGCPACRGSGFQELDMGFLPPVRVSCESCAGSGVPIEARDIELRGRTIPALLGMELGELRELWADDEELRLVLDAACAVGLDYLVAGQPSDSLSGGEVQRLRIAKELCRGGSTRSLFILDEPTVGQHQEDVARLVGVLHSLVEAGHSVLVVEHHPLLLASCDRLLELGPGAGPEGGHVIAEGTPEAVAALSTPTAPFLRAIFRAEQGA